MSIRSDIMDKNKLPALVGGVLIIALSVKTPMAVIGGVLWLWLFHRKAVGGIVPGFPGDRIPLAMFPALLSFVHMFHAEKLLSGVKPIVASLLFAWAVTLTWAFLPRAQTNTQNTTAS